MKRLVLVYSLLLITLGDVGFYTIAQDLKPNSLSSDKFRVGMYYGKKDIGTTMFGMILINQNWGSVDGIGCIGGNFEKVMHNGISFGLDICFTQIELKFDDYLSIPYNVSYNYRKFGLMPYFKYAIYKNSKLDFNFVLGAGYGIGRTIERCSNPAGRPIIIPSYKYFAFSSRIGIQVDYLISKNVGLNANFGIGQGGILSVGAFLRK